MNAPKILFLDIETTPIEGYVWSIWEQNVGLNQIKEEWSILSYAAKFKGSKAMIYEDVQGQRNLRNDKKLLKGLHKLLDEADIVVAQNGKQFDVKKINARLIMHNFKPYSPIKIVDTKLVAKAAAAFTSNKLEWLAQYLTTAKKDPHKDFPGFELWLECLKGNPKAFRELKKYNIADVVALEELYDRLLPWIVGHPNIGVYTGERVCTNCGSRDVQRRGIAITKSATYHRTHCQECGTWGREKQILIPLNKRKALLA